MASESFPNEPAQPSPPARSRVPVVIIGMTACFLFAFLFLLWLTRPPKVDPLAPRFTLTTNQPTGPFLSVHYDWSDDAPFHDGKMWLWTVLGRTNFHGYL